MKNSNRMANNVLTIIVYLGVARHLLAATAGFDVLVTDADSGIPIEGVEVVGWFGNDNGWRAWTESAPTYSDRKTTDKDGRCHVQGETNIGKTGVNIRNPPKDYYPSFGIRHQFTHKPVFPLMHWRPTDIVITASLQRVMHPLPLFVKRMGWCIGSDAIDKNGRFFACDLVKGEFLPPFGKGEIADVVFSCPPQEYIGDGFNGRNFRAPRYKNTIVAIFQGDEANGIQSVSVTNPQALLKVREALENGYQRKLTFSESMAYDLQRREGLDSGKCYCFRIRTERDEEGRIKSSLFGKIYGDPVFLLNGVDRWTQKVGGIAFLYYLNTTPNDRNLEWDRKTNLCDKPGNLETSINHTRMLLP